MYHRYVQQEAILFTLLVSRLSRPSHIPLLYSFITVSALLQAYNSHHYVTYGLPFTFPWAKVSISWATPLFAVYTLNLR